MTLASGDHPAPSEPVVVQPSFRFLDTPTRYPPVRSNHSVIENLTSYVEDRSDPLQGVGLIFDIERTFRWDRDLSLRPFEYSFMIDLVDKLDDPRFPSLDAFLKAVGNIPGFVQTGPTAFDDRQRNLFANWNELRDAVGQRTGRGMVGLVQDEPVPELDAVLSEIIPNAVAVWKTICPDRPIPPGLVDQSIQQARISNGILPVKR